MNLQSIANLSPEQQLAELFQTKTQTRQLPAPTPKTTVELAVQLGGVGTRRIKAYTFKTISAFEAEMEAKKQATEEGHLVWWVMDVYAGEPRGE